MGNIDRLVRIVIALVIAGLSYKGFISGTLATVLLIFAAVFVLTSMVKFCPLYLPFGLSTCKKED